MLVMSCNSLFMKNKVQEKTEYVIYSKSFSMDYIFYNALGYENDTIIIYENQQGGKNLKIDQKINRKELVYREKLKIVPDRPLTLQLGKGEPGKRASENVILDNNRFKVFEIIQ